MANNYSFSVMPSVNISRSRFERKSQHKMSFNLGDINVLYLDEVLPGDTRSIDMSALVRMSTPIAPIMDNIYLDVFAFFVPNRLVWDHWKAFQGENEVSAGIPSNVYSIPYIATTAAVQVGSYADQMGLPVGIASVLSRNYVSTLPFRGLAKIYNRWFRNENVIAPLPVLTSDSNAIYVGGNDSLAYSSSALLKASKLPDYFTKALPYAQKGTAVTIPLGTLAPILAVNQGTLQGVSGLVDSTTYQASAIASGNLKQYQFFGQTTGLDNFMAVADLSNATAASINQLRYAFQLQKLLEKDALYGSRYWEILAAHFGVTAPDASLQDPEYLGGTRVNINVDQVLSTAGYDPSNTTTVGAPGANSVTGMNKSLFTKSFVEHGYLFILAVARHDQTYAQGINRMWTRRSRFDFYMPVFANLGAQDIKKREIYAQGTSTDDELFGYQEAWAEYRYKPSIASGLLNPNVTGGLKFWTLTNRFTSVPTLGQTFIEQDRGSLKDALVTGASGPDFIGDFYFRDIAVRPMPVYSIPGLIDHH